MSGAAMSRREFVAGATAGSAAAWLALRVGGARAQDAHGPVYPDLAFSRPPVDRAPVFETLVGVSPMGSIHTRAATFASRQVGEPPSRRVEVDNTLRPRRDGGPGAEWAFTPTETEIAGLQVSLWLRRAPSHITLEVANDSGLPVRVSSQIHELQWPADPATKSHAWLLGPGQSVAAGDTAVLTFPIAEATAEGAETGRAIRWPTMAFFLVLDGLTRGEPYRLRLRDLTVHYGNTAGIEVTAIEAPEMLEPGQDATLAVRARGRLEDRDLSLEFRRDDWVLWREPLAADEAAALAQGEAVLRRRVPPYLAGASLTVGLVGEGYRCAGVEGRTRVAEDAPPELPRAEVREHRGRPWFHVDGEPTVWQGYSSYDYQPGNVAEFGEHRATVFCIPCAAGAHVHDVAASPLRDDGSRDYRQVDERACFSLQANPEGYLFLRISLALPRIWALEHPDQIALVQAGELFLPWEEGATYPAPSLASETWRRDQEKALRELLDHCLAQPWAERLAGLWVTCEVTEEWFAWGCNDGALADYSAPAQEDFGRWLADRGLDPAPVPLEAARRLPGHDLHPDDPDHRLAALYHRRLSELTASTIRRFSRIAKEATGGRSLVGAFFGYVVQLAGEPRQAVSGHFDLRSVLDDPSVDFIAGIPLHDFRTLRDGYNAYVTATESVAAAGKLYCNENDLFSWLHPLVWRTLYDAEDPRGGAISMHRRECAGDAARAAASQRFSLMATWHHDGALQAEFARHVDIARESLDLDRTPVEEIALLLDEATFAWTPPESTLLNHSHKRLLHALARQGAPVGVWLLSDADKLPERIRLVVAASGAAALPADVQALERLLAQGRRTIVAIGPLGLIDARTGRWDLEAPQRLLGLPVRVRDERLPGAMVATDGVAIAPEPLLTRPRAESIAESPYLRYTDGPGAYAERPLIDGGLLGWCGSPPVSPDLLARWIDAAGVHRYGPSGCFVHASRELVAITASDGGPVALKWPRPVTVTDLFDGWSGTGVEIPCPFDPGQTRLLRVRFV